jgi:transcriptional regulator GlxA family with amidase domain
MRHFILATHGHVELRLSCVAYELAVDLRTLQRSFRQIFKISMRQHQIEVRLSYAKGMLSAIPPMKISVIAATLGYRTTSDFIRFFQNHVSKSPSAWGREQRDRRE